MLVKIKSLTAFDYINYWQNLSFKAKEYSEKISQNKNLIHQLAKVILIAVILIVVPTQVKPEHTTNYKPNIKLAQKGNSIIGITQKKVSIKIGDSQYDKEEKAKQKSTSVGQSSFVAYSYNDPANFDQIYKEASNRFGVPWQILKAVHYVESGCSGSPGKTSYAGAIGPMQFMPGTWRAYGVDGNGDGFADIRNVTDAIYGAANLLAHAGASEGNIDGALFSYNHSIAYVYKVKEVASSIN